jgi:predicted DCC family thiol-disulfide oxidoreductase YuxK
MNYATFPVYVYFDHSCPLCREEMQAIKERDLFDEIKLIDASAPDFSCEFAAKNGLPQQELMRIIYLRDNKGQWLSGIDVFVALYKRVGLKSIANFWGNRFLSPILRALYPSIARWRQPLSKLGANRIYGWWIKRESARALAKSKRCQDDMCER